MPLTEEEWGERGIQVRDPNGVIVQLVDWNASPRADPVRDGGCRGVSSTAAAVPWNESSPGRQSAGVPKTMPLTGLALCSRRRSPPALFVAHGAGVMRSQVEGPAVRSLRRWR